MKLKDLLMLLRTVTRVEIRVNNTFYFRSYTDSDAMKVVENMEIDNLFVQYNRADDVCTYILVIDLKEIEE